MERKFYPENFENYLKKQADQFKMTPSKKVWRGIYNDLRPGTRWPSVAMSLVFIIALVVIGHLNSNKNYYSAHIPQFAFLTSSAPETKTTAIDQSRVTNRRAAAPAQSGTNADELINNSGQPLPANSLQNASQTSSSVNKPNADRNGDAAMRESNINNNVNNTNSEPNNNSGPENNSDKIENTISLVSERSMTVVNPGSKNTVEKNSDASLSNKPKQAAKAQQVSASETDRLAALNKSKKHTAELTYFITPSVSYRNFSEKFSTPVSHLPFIGLEGGILVGYKISKSLQFLTGAQVNYSGYNIKAGNTHPILSNLVLSDNGTTYSYSALSHYGNQTGNELVRLKNYSLQASMPFGLQYNSRGDGNIRFGAIATFQPLFVIAENAYLLSSNGKNYITDNDLVRRWNMSTNIGTFISFTSSSFKWQIGPEVHYQILSTYSNNYPFKEHLINYGIRVGVSKIFK